MTTHLAPLIGLVLLANVSCTAASKGDAPDVESGGVSFANDTQPGPKDGSAPDGEGSDSNEVPVGSDTSGADTLEPADTSDPLPDVPALPCAVDGTPCNDGDACTAGDRCASGQCHGVELACDDKLTCTQDVCTSGQCESSLIPGNCLIAGACYAGGTTNPLNLCERCDPSVSGAAWSASTGSCVAAGACGNAVGSCVQGQCVVAGGTVCPDDGNPCTTAACTNGACTQVPTAGPCDDLNGCTTGDACANGVCVGTPTVSCPDDGNPCTDAVCSGGGCLNVPKVGACEDGDPCTVGDICSGTVCMPGAGTKDSDNDQEVDKACGGTDCADGNSAIGSSKPELCSDTLDNDCDGLTDKADTDCGSTLGKACVYQGDCHPEGVCATWQGNGQTVCSARCGKQADCAPTQMCSRLPGSASLGYCEAAPTSGAPAGSACTLNSECQAGLCFEGQCRTTCFDEAGCAANEDCAWFYTAGGTFVTFCLNPQVNNISSGLKTNGQPCTFDNVSFGGDACASGLCDLTPFSSSQWKCTNVCGSEKDCAANQECHLMAYAPETATEAAPYHAQFTEVVHDGVNGCYTSLSGGGILSDGIPCDPNKYSQCKSNKCMNIDPDQPSQAFCTSFCNLDSDCVVGMKCKIVPLTLVSEYLLSDVGAQDPALAAYSYFQLCVYP